MIGRAFRYHQAASDNDNPVTQGRDFLHDVAGEDDAAVLGSQAADDVADGAGTDDIEAVGGLIEDDVLRVVNEGTGESDLGALAVGESADTAIGCGFEIE